MGHSSSCSIHSLKMELKSVSLDLILVPMGLCLTIGYHFFLWHRFKNNSSLTAALQANKIMKRSWFQMVMKDKEKNSILVVQSLRNSIMKATLVSSVAVLLNFSLAAQANNAYDAGELHDMLYVPSTGSLQLLKWAAASLFLLLGFLFNSMAAGNFSDAAFAVFLPGDYLDLSPAAGGSVQSTIERGSLLASVGNRMLYITIPFLLWMLGPVLMFFASFAMILFLYDLDFTSHGVKEGLPAMGVQVFEMI